MMKVKASRVGPDEGTRFAKVMRKPLDLDSVVEWLRRVAPTFTSPVGS